MFDSSRLSRSYVYVAQISMKTNNKIDGKYFFLFFPFKKVENECFFLILNRLYLCALEKKTLCNKTICFDNHRKFIALR